MPKFLTHQQKKTVSLTWC